MDTRGNGRKHWGYIRTFARVLPKVWFMEQYQGLVLAQFNRSEFALEGEKR